MRIRGYGWLVALVLLAMPAMQPLFSRQLTCGFDNNFHLWRAVQLGELLREGVLFSRWAPHMAQGFGYPLYLFQGPFSAYLTAVLNLLGFSWPVALNGVYGLGLLGSTVTMWVLGRELWGERGGMLAAVAYTFAPFHAYVLFYRASLSETVAWLFPPLVLWGVRRWQCEGAWRGLITAVVALALLMWTHDVTAYALLPLFIGWVVVQPQWRRGAAALGLGLGCSAFFWLPALLERGAVQFDRANSAWPFLYSNNFLPLSHFLAWPHRADPALINDWPPRALGILLLTTALMGGIMAWRRGKSRWLTGLLLAAFMGYSFLILPLSEPLWDAVPILAAFQFPWRFLAPLSLIAALLTGGIYDFRSTIDERVIVDRQSSMVNLSWVAAVVGVSVLHWGWFYPRHCAVPAALDVAGMVAWEAATRTTGTTAKDEYRPLAVARKPTAQEPPVWQNRFPVEQLPTGATLTEVDYRPLAAEITLTTAVPFIATYQAFDFPGWRVRINGRSVPITPSIPEGLITFVVPAGSSVIEVGFEETGVRVLADVLSALSFVTLVILLYLQGTSDDVRKITRPSKIVTRQPIGWLIGIGVVLALVKVGVVDQNRMTRLGADGTLAGLTVERPLTFGSGERTEATVGLLGHEVIDTVVDVGDYLEVILYWVPLNVGQGDYRVGLTLVDEDGVRWSEEGLRDSRWYRNPPPTNGWGDEGYALTAYWVDALPGTPPGRYTLELSLFERETLVPLTIFDEGGRPLGPTVALSEVVIVPSPEVWTRAEVLMQYTLADCTGVMNFCLWGSNVDRAEAAPGDVVLVTLFEAGVGGGGEIVLMDENGRLAQAWPLTLPELPAGVWRQQRLLRLSVDLADGLYTWQMRDDRGEVVAEWGAFRVMAPERILERPDVTIPIEVVFGEVITLVGANVNKERGVVTVDLVWRGEQVMAKGYHVYLHLVGPDGAVVAQSDGVPAGQRPTTGWLPGEYIEDRRQLSVPTGVDAYQLRVGLYVPGEERLLTENGEDGVFVAPPLAAPMAMTTQILMPEPLTSLAVMTPHKWLK